MQKHVYFYSSIGIFERISHKSLIQTVYHGYLNKNRNVYKALLNKSRGLCPSPPRYIHTCTFFWPILERCC